MDERKPTYEELLKDAERHKRAQKEDNTISSLIGTVVMLGAFQVFANLAITWGLAPFVLEMKMGGAEIIFCALCLVFAQIGISAYIVWHFVYVLFVNYENELKAWLKEHNFIKKQSEEKTCQ